MEAKKVLIGMSGGVDSSVAAQLMLDAGFSCIGFTMQLIAGNNQTGAQDAQAVAQRLGIPFLCIDFQDEFRCHVMDSFVAAYESGLTPNPCVCCNRTLKFGVMLERALELGCDGIVTGHYAQIRYDENLGRYLLYKAVDQTKDQTYFLYCLTQHQLAHTHFPLGGLTKQEARSIAEEKGFLNARKRDSQDICFVPDGDYFRFLQEYTQKEYPSGNFLDLSGKVVGTHRGAAGYTLGQRKGLGLAMGAPVYVCEKNMQNNTVTVGPNEALFRSQLMAKDLNWISIESLSAPMRVGVRIRHSQFEQPATIYPEDSGVRVVFDNPQRAVTPGQAVVFYQEDLVVGGGTIAESYA